MIGASSARFWASQTTVRRQSRDRPFSKPLFSQGKSAVPNDSQATVKRQSPKMGRLPGCAYPSDHSVSARTQEGQKNDDRSTKQKTAIVTGQGDRNRPLVMKCDCPDGGACRPVMLAAVYRTSRSPAPVTTTRRSAVCIYTGRQTEALGGSDATPCAVTADCCVRHPSRSDHS